MKKIISDKLVPYEKDGEIIYLTQDEYDALVDKSPNIKEHTTRKFTVPKFVYSNKELLFDTHVYPTNKVMV